MADTRTAVATRQLRTLFEFGTVAGLTDGQLLDMFVARHDEAAFTALVERHGPMVQRVCHDVLRNHHDTQDAFQATFLVLASRASAIRRRDSLASWLYGVALRVSSCARSGAARRRKHERTLAAQRPVVTLEEETCFDERGGVLHSELSRLSERLRASVVLCYLEGRTYEEAAMVLRCPVGTVKSRLASARERLRRRLEQSEFAPLAAGAALPQNPAAAPAAVSSGLVELTIREVAGRTANGASMSAAARLAQAVLKTMSLSRLGVIVGMLLVSSALTTLGVASVWRAEGQPAEAPATSGGGRAEKTTNDPGRTASVIQETKPQPVIRTGARVNLTGRVVDEKRQPVPDADVRIRLFRSNVRHLRISSEVVDTWSTRTDSLGRYRVDGVQGIQSDDYQHLSLDVNAPNFVEYCQRYFSDLSGTISRQGNLADVELKRGVSVSGRCVDLDGKAAAGAKIQAGFAKEPMSSLGRTLSTDASGRFRLNIPEGQAAELIVYPAAGAPRRVAVAAGGGDLGDIKIEPGIELDGRLLTAHGQPISGKLIAFESTDRGQFGFFPITLAYKSDADGRFHVPAVKGSFKVWATRAHDAGPDDSGPIVSDGPIPAVASQAKDFDPRSGGPRQDFTLVAGPEVAIRGTITGPDGKPAKGVCLTLIASIGGASYLTPIRWTTTDAGGRYALTGIPRGLPKAYLNVFAQPPSNDTFVDMVASGSFQGQTTHGSVSFAPLEQDQDPLDFHLKIEPLPTAAPPKVVSAEEKELVSLGEEADRLEKEFLKEMKDHPKPEGRVVLFREKSPPNVLANRFLQLAAAHPHHPAAISALGYIFRAASGAGDPLAAITKAREQAIDQVIEHHLRNRDVVFFFTVLTFGVPSPKAETLLRAALSSSPHREVQAAACYELARYLQFKADLPAAIKSMRERPRPDDPGIREAWDLSLQNMERFAAVDAPKARAEAEHLLERVGREFADVPMAQFMVDGPGRVQLSRYNSPEAKTKTFGALAEAALFELRNLAVGKPAPDIEGEDASGGKFKLSDYRGKVIVLSFSGNWCGPCREMYPFERELVSRHKDRPFAMLGVNTDPERETVRKSIQSGEITWRNWWDGGQDGPITTRWNIRSFPTVFVIDAKGIIREIDLRGTELDRAVDRLLGETTRPGKS